MNEQTDCRELILGEAGVRHCMYVFMYEQLLCIYIASKYCMIIIFLFFNGIITYNYLTTHENTALVGAPHGFVIIIFSGSVEHKHLKGQMY